MYTTGESGRASPIAFTRQTLSRSWDVGTNVNIAFVNVLQKRTFFMMEAENILWSELGANWYNINSLEAEPTTDNNLSSELTEISDSSLVGVFAYGVVLVLALILYIFVIDSLWKRYRVKKTRIFLLLLHLSLADLIVCLVIVPSEILWRLSGKWQGGNFLCKATQFFRAFGLYLSSLILICLSVDRFISIIYPMKAIGSGAYRRIKWMIAVAWIAAAVYSVPQAMLFSVRSHPNLPTHTQCVTSFPNEEDFSKVKIYSVFSLVIMYFLPLFVIATTYTAIFLKLVMKSEEQQYTNSLAPSVTDSQRDTSFSAGVPEAAVVASDNTRHTFQLRCSTNAQVKLTKAKMRTLWMTVVMIFAFVVCWTPYAVMTIWYIVDSEQAQKVDPRIQDFLFLMVVANSCINPLIYSGFSQRLKLRARISCVFFLK